MKKSFAVVGAVTVTLALGACAVLPFFASNPHSSVEMGSDSVAANALNEDSTADAPYRTYTVRGESEIMTTRVSFVATEYGHRINVKVKVDLLDPGKDRKNDVIAVYFVSHLAVSFRYDRPDTKATMSYKSTYIPRHGDSKEVYETETYTARQSMIVLDKYVAYKIKLPKDELYQDGVVLRSDITVAMEVSFDTELSDLSGTEMQSSYAHLRNIDEPNWERAISGLPLTTFYNIRFDDSWFTEVPQVE